MKEKTKAREFALRFLFHLELPIFSEQWKTLKENPSELQKQLEEFNETIDIDLSDENLALARTLVELTVENYQSLRAMIEKHSKKRKLNRISRINLSLLFLETAELVYYKKTPVNVVINEALELSKRYSTEDSASFINGILDSIAKNESI